MWLPNSWPRWAISVSQRPFGFSPTAHDEKSSFDVVFVQHVQQLPYQFPGPLHIKSETDEIGPGWPTTDGTGEWLQQLGQGPTGTETAETLLSAGRQASVGAGVGEGVCVAVGSGVQVAVGEGVCVGVAEGRSVGEGVAVAVAIAVGLGVKVAVIDGVAVTEITT